MKSPEGNMMTVRDYWGVVWRRKVMIIVAFAVTVISASAFTALQDPKYVAQAKLLLQSTPGETVFDSGAAASDNGKNTANEIQVLEGDVVRRQLMSDLGLIVKPPAVSGFSDDTTDVISVEVTSGDPDTAAALANAYVSAYTTVKREQAVDGLSKAATQLQVKVSGLQQQIDAVDTKLADETDVDARSQLFSQRELLVDTQTTFKTRLDQVQVDQALATGSSQLIEPAIVPTDPVSPTPKKTVLLAGIIGLILGLAAAFLIDFLDDSVRSADDLQRLGFDVAVLSEVPMVATLGKGPLADTNADHLAVEAYRSLRTGVQFMGFEREISVIEVTSPFAGEGKTTTAANLAVVLAQTGRSVVLVDADLRRPRVHEMFGLPVSPGLTDVLLGNAIDDASHRLPSGLIVITAGSMPPNPSEILSGRRMGLLLGELRRQLDYVVIDTSPSLLVSDAVALTSHVDGVVLVAQANRTSLQQLREAVGNFERVGAPLLGIVLNKVTHGRQTVGYGNAYTPLPSKLDEPPSL